MAYCAAPSPYMTSANPFYTGYTSQPSTPCGRYPQAGCPSYTKAPTQVDFSLGYNKPPTSTELHNLKCQLHARLNENRVSNMPSGFPFVYAMSSRGDYSRSRSTPYQFEEHFNVPTASGYSIRRSVVIQFSGPKVPNGPSFWRIHHVNADRKLHPQQNVPFAQVQLHPEVMATRYGRCIEKDSRIILRALALSVELGVLVTITTQAALENRPTKRDNIVYVGTTASGIASVIYSTLC
ncbi:hypothetical protein BDZ89DRAFT_1162330 [Hymenopellis radicata]|nr:hypothetical protein BDZ89DRAFT_1162330 [Hymenopellis radicata]